MSGEHEADTEQRGPDARGAAATSDDPRSVMVGPRTGAGNCCTIGRVPTDAREAAATTRPRPWSLSASSSPTTIALASSDEPP